MVYGMDLRIFRLARAGGIDTNPTTFTQRAGTFASAGAHFEGDMSAYPAAQSYARPVTAGAPSWQQ